MRNKFAIMKVHPSFRKKLKQMSAEQETTIVSLTKRLAEDTDFEEDFKKNKTRRISIGF